MYIASPCLKEATNHDFGSEGRTTKDTDSWKKEFLKKLEEVKSLETGSMSMDAPARDWVGYNPTHTGFQILQEAYEKGEWVGNLPQFKLPKAFRKAGITKLTAEAAAKRKNAQDQQPQSGAETRANTSGKPVETFRFIRDEDGDKLEFSAEMNDDLRKQMKEVEEVAKLPLGRALLQMEFGRSLRHFGLNLHVDDEADALSSSTESGSADEMDIDEPDHVPAKEVNTQEPGSSGNRETARYSSFSPQPNVSPGKGSDFTQAEVKRWLGSM
ncbi:hypothetical protein M406DRAFT_326445 [Cryphonectria parasitica EP155]|uniref:Uncharacterized protein n=1 Tax=Cryphonectria parasitica (strain ATCC 38755 / EP155) TaxID=660469 RepID=A0A9P4YDY3_CRYP1|nr:uncharacterized protein M406DRAFT_326445 [Cryphonectria parasitica EP155]KAF3771042.1 hypothetical protein M406DRAFT_326445 [Cryphonectria parasitica EP155]